MHFKNNCKITKTGVLYSYGTVPIFFSKALDCIVPLFLIFRPACSKLQAVKPSWLENGQR